MVPHEIWTNLEMIFHLTPRQLYDSPEMEELHRDCRRAVTRMSNSEKRDSLSRYVRDVMLTEDQIAHGGGWETVLAFLDWVDGGME